MKVVLTLMENKILAHPMFKVTVGPPVTCIRIGLKDDRYGDRIREVLRGKNRGSTGDQSLVAICTFAVVRQNCTAIVESPAPSNNHSERPDIVGREGLVWRLLCWGSFVSPG